MYEELVKRLLYIANSDTNIKSNHIGLTMIQAADAIEELSKLANAIPHVCECCVGCELEKKNGGCDHAFVLSPKRAMIYLSKPRWVPVTERLPDDGVYVLAYSADDDYMCVEARHKFAAFQITHWMPLPTPPKEET
jgi:hypothetical protein